MFSFHLDVLLHQRSLDHFFCHSFNDLSVVVMRYSDKQRYGYIVKKESSEKNVSFEVVENLFKSLSKFLVKESFVVI